MVAIVTKEIRVQNAANFISDVGSNSMYLFVGHPQQWPSSDTAISGIACSVRVISFFSLRNLKKFEDLGDHVAIFREKIANMPNFL